MRGTRTKKLPDTTFPDAVRRLLEKHPFDPQPPPTETVRERPSRRPPEGPTDDLQTMLERVPDPPGTHPPETVLDALQTGRELPPPPSARAEVDVELDKRLIRDDFEMRRSLAEQRARVAAVGRRPSALEVTMRWMTDHLPSFDTIEERFGGRIPTDADGAPLVRLSVHRPVDMCHMMLRLHEMGSIEDEADGRPRWVPKNAEDAWMLDGPDAIPGVSANLGVSKEALERDPMACVVEHEGMRVLLVHQLLLNVCARLQRKGRVEPEDLIVGVAAELGKLLTPLEGTEHLAAAGRADFCPSGAGEGIVNSLSHVLGPGEPIVVVLQCATIVFGVVSYIVKKSGDSRLWGLRVAWMLQWLQIVVNMLLISDYGVPIVREQPSNLYMEMLDRQCDDLKPPSDSWIYRIDMRTTYRGMLELLYVSTLIARMSQQGSTGVMRKTTMAKLLTTDPSQMLDRFPYEHSDHSAVVQKLRAEPQETTLLYRHMCAVFAKYVEMQMKIKWEQDGSKHNDIRNLSSIRSFLKLTKEYFKKVDERDKERDKERDERVKMAKENKNKSPKTADEQKKQQEKEDQEHLEKHAKELVAVLETPWEDDERQEDAVKMSKCMQTACYQNDAKLRPPISWELDIQPKTGYLETFLEKYANANSADEIAFKDLLEEYQFDFEEDNQLDVFEALLKKVFECKKDLRLGKDNQIVRKTEKLIYKWAGRVLIYRRAIDQLKRLKRAKENVPLAVVDVLTTAVCPLILMQDTRTFQSRLTDVKNADSFWTKLYNTVFKTVVGRSQTPVWGSGKPFVRVFNERYAKFYLLVAQNAVGAAATIATLQSRNNWKGSKTEAAFIELAGLFDPFFEGNIPEALTEIDLIENPRQFLETMRDKISKRCHFIDSVRVVNLRPEQLLKKIERIAKGCSNIMWGQLPPPDPKESMDLPLQNTLGVLFSKISELFLLCCMLVVALMLSVGQTVRPAGVEDALVRRVGRGVGPAEVEDDEETKEETEFQELKEAEGHFYASTGPRRGRSSSPGPRQSTESDLSIELQKLKQVGKATVRNLHDVNIDTLEDLYRLQEKDLEKKLELAKVQGRQAKAVLRFFKRRSRELADNDSGETQTSELADNDSGEAQTTELGDNDSEEAQTTVIQKIQKILNFFLNRQERREATDEGKRDDDVHDVSHNAQEEINELFQAQVIKRTLRVSRFILHGRVRADHLTPLLLKIVFGLLSTMVLFLGTVGKAFVSSFRPKYLPRSIFGEDSGIQKYLTKYDTIIPIYEIDYDVWKAHWAVATNTFVVCAVILGGMTSTPKWSVRLVMRIAKAAVAIFMLSATGVATTAGAVLLLSSMHRVIDMTSWIGLFFTGLLNGYFNPLDKIFVNPLSKFFIGTPTLMLTFYNRNAIRDVIGYNRNAIRDVIGDAINAVEPLKTLLITIVKKPYIMLSGIIEPARRRVGKSDNSEMEQTRWKNSMDELIRASPSTVIGGDMHGNDCATVQWFYNDVFQQMQAERGLESAHVDAEDMRQRIEKTLISPIEYLRVVGAYDYCPEKVDEEIWQQYRSETVVDNIVEEVLKSDAWWRVVDMCFLEPNDKKFLQNMTVLQNKTRSAQDFYQWMNQGNRWEMFESIRETLREKLWNGRTEGATKMVYGAILKLMHEHPMNSDVGLLRNLMRHVAPTGVEGSSYRDRDVTGTISDESRWNLTWNGMWMIFLNRKTNYTDLVKFHTFKVDRLANSSMTDDEYIKGLCINMEKDAEEDIQKQAPSLASRRIEEEYVILSHVLAWCLTMSVMMLSTLEPTLGPMSMWLVELVTRIRNCLSYIIFSLSN